MATSVAVDFEPDEDDLMDNVPAAAAPKFRSTITAAGDAKKTKGGGFRQSEAVSQCPSHLADANFDSPTSVDGPVPVPVPVPVPQRCEPLSNDQNMRKIIRSLPKSWEVNATTLKEQNDAKEMNFTVFMGSLKTHEMEIKARVDKERQAKEIQKKSVALRAFKAISVSDDDSSSDGDKDLSKITMALGKLLLKDEKKKEKPVTCYKCMQPGYYSNK